MSKKRPPAWIKPALDFVPLLIFFAAYNFAPVAEGASDEDRQLGQILFATTIFVPVILAALALSWFLLKSLPKMAVVTAVVVVIFGGLTLWLRDDTFIKMKPTVIYVVFASALGLGLMRGRSYLQYLMEAQISLTFEGWMSFTKRFALFFLALAIANEAVWRLTDTDTWVNFKTFGLTIGMFVFIAAQAKLFDKHAINFRAGWLAVRCEDPMLVAEALELTETKEVRFDSGLNSAVSTEERIYVTPPEDGWVLVVTGNDLGANTPDKLTEARALLGKLSEKFDEAQLFASYRTDGYFAWIRATGGEVTRALVYAGGQLLTNEGETSEAETEIGLAEFASLDATAVAARLEAEDGAETVARIAGHWSVDPFGTDDDDDEASGEGGSQDASKSEAEGEKADTEEKEPEIKGVLGYLP